MNEHVPPPRTDLPWSEQFRITAKKWVEADAAASLLEETRTAFLSQLMISSEEKSIAAAERMAKTSPEWLEFNKNMVEARKDANLLKIQLEYIKMRHGEAQSAEATARAEMRIDR